MKTIEEHQTAVDLVVAQYIEAASNALTEIEYSSKPDDIERVRCLIDLKELCGKFLELFIDRQTELDNYLFDPDMPMGTGDTRTPADKLAGHVDKDRPSFLGRTLRDTIQRDTLTLYSMID